MEYSIWEAYRNRYVESVRSSHRKFGPLDFDGTLSGVWAIFKLTGECGTPSWSCEPAGPVRLWNHNVGLRQPKECAHETLVPMVDDVPAVGIESYVIVTIAISWDQCVLRVSLCS